MAKSRSFKDLIDEVVRKEDPALAQGYLHDFSRGRRVYDVENGG